MAGLLRYPLEALTQTTDYLQIGIVEYQSVKDRGSGSFVGSPGSRRIGGNTPIGTRNKDKKMHETIILQMPSNIQDGNGVDYGESEMNTLQGAAAGAVGSVVEGSGDALKKLLQKDKTGADGAIKGIGKDLKDQFKGTDVEGLMGAGAKFATASATAATLGLVGGNVSVNQLLARQSGQVFNPNMELLFNGPTLRSFNFGFKMTPRSSEEAREVKKIIRAFKSNMAPKTKGGGSLGGSGIFLKTPNVFEIRYRKGSRDHPFLHKFKQCFLTDISVNYTAEGVYATYDDATPISLQMDLTFKELEPIYDVDYDDNDGSVGF
tara:strand:- start:5627 stop:6586 length:960 start_codon:yes stop_codon:yes gene_type:complete